MFCNVFFDIALTLEADSFSRAFDKGLADNTRKLIGISTDVA